MEINKKKLESEVNRIKHEMCQFLSSARGIDYWIMEDIIDQCQAEVTDYLTGESTAESVESIIWDYLELGEWYAWVFVVSVIPDFMKDDSELDISESEELK